VTHVKDRYKWKAVSHATESWRRTLRFILIWLVMTICSARSVMILLVCITGTFAPVIMNYLPITHHLL
jgi:hypothetical protein